MCARRSRAGQALGGDAPALGTSIGLQDVKQSEPHRLLYVGVAVDSDVGGVPEVIEVRPLLLQQPLEAGVARSSQGGGDLVTQPGR